MNFSSINEMKKLDNTTLEKEINLVSQELINLRVKKWYRTLVNTIFLIVNIPFIILNNIEAFNNFFIPAPDRSLRYFHDLIISKYQKLAISW